MGCLAPVILCEPPNRKLSKEDELRALMHEYIKTHQIGPKAFDHLRRIFAHFTIEIGLESVKKLQNWALKKSGYIAQWYNNCPSHFSYADSDLLHCPIIIRDPDTGNEAPCGISRYQ